MEETKKRNLHITISGEHGSERFRMLYLIKKLLREQGCEVEFESNKNSDFETEAQLDEYMSQNFSKAFDIIKSERKVIKKTVQLPCESR